MIVDFSGRRRFFMLRICWLGQWISLRIQLYAMHCFENSVERYKLPPQGASVQSVDSNNHQQQQQMAVEWFVFW